MERQPELAKAELQKKLQDRRWRLANLYRVIDKDGNAVAFKPNWAQLALLDDLHNQNLILKARQIGFTTFLQLYMLDACLFNSNIRAGTIAHRLDDAKVIFRDKIKYAYDNLPDWLRAARPVKKEAAEELVFANNSSIRVGVSMRSGTLQYLHVSEYGKACAQFPEKAREIRTGALNTVQAGQVVFIELTAEGQEGHFFDLCDDAQAKQRVGSKLTPLDFKFFFFPWHKEPGYAIDPEGVVIAEGHRKYFETLETSHGIILSPAQRAWYVKKAETQLGDMKREYPSTPEEAFEASVEGAYYSEQMAQAELQGRIGDYPAVEGFPVHTAWDLGIGDATAIWFFQVVGGRVRVVGYLENSGEGMPWYAAELRRMAQERGWTYGRIHLPHDGGHREWGTGRTRIEQVHAERISSKYPIVLPLGSVDDGINAVRATLPLCTFDAGPCAEGIKVLKGYRKEWDEDRSCFKDRPRHDWASHGADGFRVLALGWRQVTSETVGPASSWAPPRDINQAPPMIAVQDKWGIVHVTGGETPMAFAQRRQRQRKAAGY